MMVSENMPETEKATIRTVIRGRKETASEVRDGQQLIASMLRLGIPDRVIVLLRENLTVTQMGMVVNAFWEQRAEFQMPEPLPEPK